MGRFDGMAVLITGATGGFGRRASERFAEEGASLVLSDIDAGRLNEFAASLKAETATLAGDIAHESLSEELVKLALERFGTLDVALNNAGITHAFVRLPNVPTDEARRVLEVDLLAVYFAMKYQLPAMERQFRETRRRASIVNIASAAGMNGAPKMSVYSAAKHGVIGLTRSAAAEYATKGIRVNAICPAYARTAMAEAFVKLTRTPEDVAYAELTRGVPMKRLGEVDEVIEAILFAADPKNSFMTGVSLPVDGGISAV